MSTTKQRMKTKTFTGCWTCRRRKVKCDEGRPGCQQCRDKAISCAGYTTRLQWLPAETPLAYSRSAQLPTTYRTTGMSLRRHMRCDETQPILTEIQLDTYLERVEAERPLAGGPSLLHGPFALFAQEAEEKEARARERERLGQQKALQVVVATVLTADTQQLVPDSPSTEQTPPVVSPQEQQLPGPLLLPNTPNESLVLSDVVRDDLSITSSPLYDEAAPVGLTGSTTPSPDVSNGDDSFEDDAWTPAPGSSTLHYRILFQRSPFQLSADSQQLLHHYIDHVVDLMTVVSTPKGPWKSVHLPRALQGTAELAFAGRTSHACNALFHALLTISAYNLAANHSITGQEMQAQRWRGIALRFKARSLTYLREGLAPQCPPEKRGKYKEILAVMLSMITIDVCSGETRTSEWHLKGLEGFIHTSRHRRKSHYSGKAQSLHRVYAYLRIMRESTDLRCVERKDNTQSPSAQDLAWLSAPLFFLDAISLPPNWLQDNCPTDVAKQKQVDLSACEFVYGIPFTLLVLMAKTSELIRRKRTFERNFPHLMLPQETAVLCDALEVEILEWSVDAVVAELQELTVSRDFQRLIEHQTRAFHQATIVYFSHLVRSVHRRHLQPYVRNIINHLETIEVIKYGANMTTGCILWPGFIGAAEAVDADVQSRYLQWFKSTRFYGLGAYDKACEVVMEVWEKQKLGQGQTACEWSVIVEAKDIRLMLT